VKATVKVQISQEAIHFLQLLRILSFKGIINLIESSGSSLENRN
jgi:hypothetical protein